MITNIIDYSNGVIYSNLSIDYCYEKKYCICPHAYAHAIDSMWHLKTAPFLQSVLARCRTVGNAVSNRGLELGLGSEWMMHENMLIQNAERMSDYPELEKHLAMGIAEFPEIIVDSVLFYSPARKLLFVNYHQAKPLRPTSELFLHSDSAHVFYEENAKVFGRISTHIEDDGWENGPQNSVYNNVRYKPKKKQIVLLQRIPYDGENIAIFQIRKTKPKRGTWWTQYPIGPYWSVDLGNLDNIETINLFLQEARTTAVSNLKIRLEHKK